MKYFTLSLFTLFFLLANSMSAQFQKPTAPPNSGTTTVDVENLIINRKNQSAIPTASPSVFSQRSFDFKTQFPLQRKGRGEHHLQIKRNANNNLPIWIKGTPETEASGIRTADVLTVEYLTAVKDLIQIEDPETEFLIKTSRTDKHGQQHLRLQQEFSGIPVYGAEVVLHEKDGAIYLFNGRYYPTPQLDDLAPVLSESAAKNLVQETIAQHTAFKTLSEAEAQFLPQAQLSASLVIYHPEEADDAERLTWHVTAVPNLVSRWEYFVDAVDGTILHHYNNICQIHGGRCAAHPHGQDHIDIKIETEVRTTTNELTFTPSMVGPTTANATDLSGVNRLINVYEDGGTYFMIDASRTMYNAGQSNIPNEPVGAVWTIDGNNNSPANNSFEASHVTSSNNSWNSAVSVSAHYNGGEAYEYFKQTFNRNSINGSGGTIVSLINITDENGQDMDNAFWNGQAMFYGNGAQAFQPLAKALDVAGHEMAHGVIQSTANLAYQNESGALNESFADIFGAMIDRDDWKIGEEIANSSVFPTGTMRDMQNPHNGGNSSDFYWQPDHYSERYTGSQDNGGVHINSGIPNHAYYLFANTSGVGKEKAEQVYYIALEDFLVASSKFVDLRNAIVEVAQNEYGTAVSNAAANAFEQVGIGQGAGTTTQTDNGTNPGDDFILWSDVALSNVNNALPTNGVDNGTLSTMDHISKPSVSDNGAYIDFVGSDNNLWEVNMDWATGNIVDEYTLSTAGNWRNVATAKNGLRIAAVTTDYDNLVFVYDFGLQEWETFELYNPTFTQGVTTGDVDFADVLEFDITGEYLMYDAQSTINGDFGDDISYWDIGFLRVWNNQNNTFSDGEIQKLFSGLPENVSVGNPTFSKDSPYIIAFDYIENTTSGTEYAVLGINLETSDQGTIWENDRLGYPSYSPDDTKIAFTGSNGNNNPIIGVRNVASDKITGTGDPTGLIENAAWAVWFATGERELVSTYEVGDLNGELKVAPNPFNEELQLDYVSKSRTEAKVTVYDLMGRNVYQSVEQLQVGDNRMVLPLAHLATGTYIVQLQTEKGLLAKKLMKSIDK